MGRKKEKHGGKVVAPQQTPTITPMQFMMVDLDNFNDKIYICQSDKFNWTVHLYRGTFFKEDYLVMDAYCHTHQTNWACDANIQVYIWDRSVQLIKHHFESKKNCMSCPAFMKWADFVNPDNGYVHDGRVIVDIHITETPKLAEKNLSVVTKEYPGITNLWLTVGRSRFHVNKELLAHTSQFFLDELKNKKLKDNYVIDDISPCDFKLFLDLTYNPKQYFSSFHAKDMLDVAKRFGNTEIVPTCHNVVLEDLKDNKISTKDRVKMADTYDFETARELFTSETTASPSSHPRFMTLERFKQGAQKPSPSTKCPEVHTITSKTLEKYRNDYRNRDKTKVEKNEEVVVEAVQEKNVEEVDDDVIFICHIDHRAKRQAMWDKLEIEQEEEFDWTMPSTSGCR
ncbi:hypothetical protein L5515_006103 [Caenorhabditis briggsae]|uniref:BTB domain-containing protein n=1 Tax=Caenorhabditis briggsae TaxID=6238 RepID=A0AAE9EZZ1_CAEBR|nr:hypothetical protein L5515_006103 [Caenorhabditis briggsae]